MILIRWLTAAPLILKLSASLDLLDNRRFQFIFRKGYNKISREWCDNRPNQFLGLYNRAEK
jgi:hypothetical protein